MLTLQIWNVSKLADVSDYKYRVLINDKVITTGVIEKHENGQGWVKLVGRIVEAHKKATWSGKEFDAVLALVVHDGGKPRRRKRRAA